MSTVKNTKEKSWWEIEADGKIIGIMEESGSTPGEIKRLENLQGISIRPATPESLIKFGAKTIIPKSKVMQFELAFETSESKKKRYYS